MNKCHEFNHIYLYTYLDATGQNFKKHKLDDPDLIV
jgi:hypothetical protein